METSPSAAADAAMKISPVAATEDTADVMPTTDEDWVAAGREFMAQFESDFGAIPEVARDKVRRKWRG